MGRHTAAAPSRALKPAHLQEHCTATAWRKGSHQHDASDWWYYRVLHQEEHEKEREDGHQHDASAAVAGMMLVVRLHKHK
jgi:uncharacterized protein involved in copper resistance